MPELPEVETVRQALRLRILNQKIEYVEVIVSRLIQPLTCQDFSSILAGQTVFDIDRRGKYLIFRLSQNDLVVHLRMEGRFFLKPESEPIDKHEHVIFHFDNQRTLRFHDVRKFGTFTILPKGQGMIAEGIRKLGPEPGEPDLTLAYLKQKIQVSLRPIKSLLLDQTVIAGLGNIYVDEVLHEALIHPTRMGKSLSDSEMRTLLEKSHEIIAEAVKEGGTTIRSYVSSLGVSGRFQNQLKVHTLVGKPCHTCQTPIIKIRVGGRGTYVCPTCQK